MSFDFDPKCTRELKQLGKKYRQLPGDLDAFCQTHQAAHDPDQPEDFRRNFFAGNNATVLHQTPDGQTKIVKARLYSSDLKNKSLRVIYLVKNQQLTLIEIYAKNNKAMEDTRRWQTYKPK